MNRTRIAFGISLVTLLALVATDASARDRSVKRVGPHGGGYTKTVEIQRTDNGYTRNAVHTGPNGGTVTRSTVVERADDGSITKTVQIDRQPPQNAVAPAQ